MVSRTQHGIGEVVASAVCFAAVLGALIGVDPRVRERASLLFAEAGSAGLEPWGDRANALAAVVAQAAREQSIDNAPLLIFSVVAVVLVVFMLRS